MPIQAKFATQEMLGIHETPTTPIPTPPTSELHDEGNNETNSHSEEEWEESESEQDLKYEVARIFNVDEAEDD
jgi:hypothetical protein